MRADVVVPKQDPLLLWGERSFPLRPSTGWTVLSHIVEANLLHLRSTGGKYLSRLKKLTSATSRQMFDQTTGHRAQAS